MLGAIVAEAYADMMSIHPLVLAKQVEIAALCRAHGVKTLELFGSAATQGFDWARSDLDFLVEFQPMNSSGRKSEFFGLLFGLEDLFKRRIDLIERAPIRNPYFLAEVDATRVGLYAA